MNAASAIYLDVDVRKKINEFSLNINFQAGKGCLGLLGPSGCGKSMTLKSIAGIGKPDEGRIAVCNALAQSGNQNGSTRVLFDSSGKINLRPQIRRVGYLFQNYALFPNMTIEQNIMTGLGGCWNHAFWQKKGALTPEARKRRVREMIEWFRLEGLEKRYPGQLSGGQQQRAALARSLAYEPDILLLDEPFSAMDTYLREGLRLELARVLKAYDGIAVMVTHDRDEAYQLCDHLLLMSGGSVLAFGETREIFQNPRTSQAARLTGCKNISRIERLGKYRVKALDWQGLELVTAQPVDDTITSVGIRAHDFEPLSDSAANAWIAGENRESANLIPVSSPSVSEMPFEWYITLDNGLWWKTEKDIHTHSAAGVVPGWLRIDPSAILLLTGSTE